MERRGKAGGMEMTIICVTRNQSNGAKPDAEQNQHRNSPPFFPTDNSLSSSSSNKYMKRNGRPGFRNTSSPASRDSLRPSPHQKKAAVPSTSLTLLRLLLRLPTTSFPGNESGLDSLLLPPRLQYRAPSSFDSIRSFAGSLRRIND